MMYKTIVINYAPKTKKMAEAIEHKANQMAQAGWELVTFSITNSAKAILVFSVPELTAQEENSCEEAAEESISSEETAEEVGETE